MVALWRVPGAFPAGLPDWPGLKRVSFFSFGAALVGFFIITPFFTRLTYTVETDLNQFNAELVDYNPSMKWTYPVLMIWPLSFGEMPEA